MWRSGPIGGRTLGVSFGASIRVRSPIGPASIARTGPSLGPIWWAALARARGSVKVAQFMLGDRPAQNQPIGLVWHADCLQCAKKILWYGMNDAWFGLK